MDSHSSELLPRCTPCEDLKKHHHSVESAMEVGKSYGIPLHVHDYPCMYMYICVCIVYIYIHIYMCVLCVYVCVCMYISIYTMYCVYIYTVYICVCVLFIARICILYRENHSKSSLEPLGIRDHQSAGF